MEEFYYEESHEHIFLKCLILLFIIGLLIGVFLFYRSKNTIKLRNIKVEIGSELSQDVRDYLINGESNISDYKLFLDNVNLNKVGEYTYHVKYNKHVKKAKIIVRDTVGPKVLLDNITIGINEEFDPNFLLVSCDDYSLPCKVSFENDKDKNLLSKEGNYNLMFNISDSFGNTTKSSATISVSSKETLSSTMTNDLKYYTNSENSDTINEVFFKKFDKAIIEDTIEFEGIIQEISANDFDAYVSKDIYSTKLIIVYNKYGYVIGIQVEVTFDDGTKEFIEDKVINSEEE